ncbi:MAG: hypothetical protein FWD69_07900 [Polyangiaceae bacterium]|nr:hypothetical protein [Polyangiaceae bacterium]
MALFGVLAFSTNAHAQASPEPPAPPPSPGVRDGVDVHVDVHAPSSPAPLSQTTQPSYVPQSVAMSGPRVINGYHEGDTIPPGYHPATRMRTGLITAGAVTFGVLYSLSSLAAAISADANTHESNPLGAMWIPCVGPFIQMARTDSDTGKYFLFLNGAAQTAGLAMLVIGLTVPRTVLVRNDLAQNKPTLRPVPILTRDMGGAGIVGTF